MKTQETGNSNGSGGSKKGSQGIMSKVKKEIAKLLPEEENELRKVFENELKDLYYVENALVDELPNMAKMATSVELVAAISNHHSETKVHVQRLEQIFDSLGMEPEEKKCKAMSGLIDETHEHIAQTEEDSKVRDVVIIACSQKVEHYEMAAYGTLRTLAGVLNLPAAERLLEETLEEEKAADLLLTTIAESFINEEAMEESEEDNKE